MRRVPLFLGVPVVIGASLAVVALWRTPPREDARVAPVAVTGRATDIRLPTVVVVSPTPGGPRLWRLEPAWVVPPTPVRVATEQAPPERSRPAVRRYLPPAPVTPPPPAVLRLEQIYDTPLPQLERILYPDNYDWRGRR